MPLRVAFVARFCCLKLAWFSPRSWPEHLEILVCLLFLGNVWFLESLVLTCFCSSSIFFSVLLQILRGKKLCPTPTHLVVINRRLSYQ